MLYRLLRHTALPVLLAVAAPAQASPSYESAAAALAKGDPLAARVELLNAIKANPEDGRAHLLQGRVYLELGDGLAAEAEIRRARQTGIPVEQTHHLLAHAFLLQNQPERVLEEVTRTPRRFAPYALRMRGRAQAVMGQPRQAALEFDRALALAPGDADLWSDIGRLRLATGDLRGALEAAHRAVALAPRDIDGLILQGDVARARANPPQALRWYDRALGVDRGNVPALLGRAGALSEAGRMREMLAVTRRILSLDHKNPFAFHLQARLAAMAGNYTLARSLLQRTGTALDTYPAAMLLAGIVEYRTGNDEQAIERLGRLVAMQPDNIKARRFLAMAQWRTGDANAVLAALKPLVDRGDADRPALVLMARVLEGRGDKAAAQAYRLRAGQPAPERLVKLVVAADRAMNSRQWRAAIGLYEFLRKETGGKDAAILNNLAWAYAHSDRLDRALSMAAAAFKLTPDNPSVIDSYGWFLHRSGKDRARALQMLQTAAARMPANATIRWHLAQAYASAGRKADAHREIKAALATPSFSEQQEARALMATL